MAADPEIAPETVKAFNDLARSVVAAITQLAQALAPAFQAFAEAARTPEVQAALQQAREGHRLDLERVTEAQRHEISKPYPEGGTRAREKAESQPKRDPTDPVGPFPRA
jgi:hypothetical protein